MSNQSSTSINCGSCGHPNPAWNSECKNCEAKLSLRSTSPASNPSSQPSARSRAHHVQQPERPGCVSAYASLIGITAVLSGLGGLATGFTTFGSNSEVAGFGLIYMVIALGVAGFQLFLAKSLWDLQNWSRIFIIVTHSISLIGPLILIFILLLSPTTVENIGVVVMLCGIGLQIAIPGYVIYWFADNGQYFR